MLTARNVIVAVFTIAVLSIIGVVIDLARPPDSGGLARDSYGTRAFGHRALYELLEELEVSVERALVPPGGVIHRDVCLVFVSPHADLVNVEPDHLRKVGQWVRAGGTVIIAPPADDPLANRFGPPGGWNPYDHERSALQELGLTGVSLESVPGPGSAGAEGTGTQGDPDDSTADSGSRPPWMRRVEPPLLASIDVGADGELAELGDFVTALSVPDTLLLQVIDSASSASAAGRIYWRAPDGNEHTLVGLYPHGQGSVVVISDPVLFRNLSIAGKDNAVLAAHLLARPGRPIVFDEFYHGLTVRGNPVSLFTRHPYGLLAILILLASAIWVWRGLVHLGPPLAVEKARRRTLSEYVEAMANVFLRGNCPAFVLREVRNGVLWALRKRLHLSPGQENVEEIARALARRKPNEADRLLEAVAGVDALLRTGLRPRQASVVQAAGKVAEHL